MAEWTDILPVVGPIDTFDRWINHGGTGRDVAAQVYGFVDPLGGYALLGTNAQLDAAEDAARRAQLAGMMGSAETLIGGQQALGYAQQGQASALEEYQRALANSEAEQAGLQSMFAQEMAAGQGATSALERAMAGDMSGVQFDPAYAMRQREMQQALDRQAAAGGNYGGGAHLKTTIRGQQDLASREYQSAIERLMGLAGYGQQATNTYAGLNQSSANNIMGLYGAMADAYEQGGRYQANLRNNMAAAYANALTGQASNVNNYMIQGANAVAHGAAQLGQNYANAGKVASFFASK